eukprot:m.15527 g.15527  ORF g.15527 m.15527 type:complete len:987 (-) comp7401_c0_seq1:354-3314(-)
MEALVQSLPPLTDEQWMRSEDVPLELPFVDRESECADIAYTMCWNAIIFQTSSHVVGLRQMRVLIASQMFGSGKTSIAEHVLDQLQQARVRDRFRQLLREKSMSEADAAEYQSMYDSIAASAELHLVDARGLRTLGDLQSEMRLDARDTFGSQLANLIRHTQKQHTLIAFDEVEVDLAVLHDLLQTFLAAYGRLYRDGDNTMTTKWVHFMLIGKCIEFTKLGMRGSSPLQYAWIRLHMLEEKHIKEVIDRLKERANNPPLQNVHAGNIDAVVQAVHVWTAGGPRLLLYSLRLLQKLSKLSPGPWPAVARPAKVGDNPLLTLLQKYANQLHAAIRAELAFVETDSLGATDLAGMYITLYQTSKYNRTLTTSTKIYGQSGTWKVMDLMRHLPIYISRVDGGGEHFRIVFPLLVVQTKLAKMDGVKIPALLPRSTEPLPQKSLLFKELVRTRFITECLVDGVSLITFSDLFGIRGCGSALDLVPLVVDGVKTVVVTSGVKASASQPAVDGRQPDLDDLLAQLSLSRPELQSVLQGVAPFRWIQSRDSKSAESDGKYKGVRCSSENVLREALMLTSINDQPPSIMQHLNLLLKENKATLHLVETQQKHRQKSEFTFGQLHDEVEKCIRPTAAATADAAVAIRSVSLVIMATQLDAFTTSVMGESACLVLPTGTYFRQAKKFVLFKAAEKVPAPTPTPSRRPQHRDGGSASASPGGRGGSGDGVVGGGRGGAAVAAGSSRSSSDTVEFELVMAAGTQFPLRAQSEEPHTTKLTINGREYWIDGSAWPDGLGNEFSFDITGDVARSSTSKTLPSGRPTSVTKGLPSADPSKADRKHVPAPKPLQIPPGLEVVVLSQRALQQFLGDQDYAVLVNNTEGLSAHNDAFVALVDSYVQELQYRHRQPDGTRTAVAESVSSQAARTASAAPRPMTLEDLLGMGAISDAQYFQEKEKEREEKKRQETIAFLQDSLKDPGLTADERRECRATLKKLMGI